MQEAIVVRSVLERNNCAGKKEIFVSAMGSDEIVMSLYRIDHRWLPPHEKLALATVDEFDEILVVNQLHMENPQLAGDFITNLSDTHLRTPICRCGTQMVSDGFDIHCPNSDCALTVWARLERLVNTEFFDFESLSITHLYAYPSSKEDMSLYTHPFKMVGQGVFWGYPGGSVESALLKRRHKDSLATFLVPDLFQEFLASRGSPSYLDEAAIMNIERFYNELQQTIAHRNDNCPMQYRLLTGFLWALGIESLRPDLIERLVDYEINASINDPMLLFAYVLTNIEELTLQLGLYHIEAATIVSEVHRRKHEFHDIFYHYALNKQDIANIFNRLR